MGIAEVYTADFSAIRGGIDPAVPGVSGLHMFGGTLAASAVNYGGGGAGSFVGAAPVPAAGHVPFDGALQGMDTSVAETAAMTVLMVVRPEVITIPAATNPYLISTNTGIASVGGATINGLSMFFNNTSDGRLTVSATRHNGAGVNSQITTNLTGVNAPPQGQWSLLGFRISDTGCVLDDLTRGRTDITISALARNPTVTTMRIGTRKSTFSGIGKADHHSCMIYPSYLTDVNYALVAAQMRALAAQKGITV